MRPLPMDRAVLIAQLKDADEIIATRQNEIDQLKLDIDQSGPIDAAASDAREKLQRLQLALQLYREHRQRLADELTGTTPGDVNARES